MHKFDVSHKGKLDNEWRRKNLPPISTLEALELKENDIVADVGCGIGYFSIPAAEIVKSTNKVFALDILEEMLLHVEKRSTIAGTNHVITIATEEYDTKLPDTSVTYVLLAFVLHEIEDKMRMITEVKRIVKSQGKVVILEWIKQPMEVGPPVEERLGSQEVEHLMQDSGLTKNKEMHFSNMFYAYVYVKN